MAKDEKLLAREELPDHGYFFRCDGRDGVAGIFSGVAFEQDAGSFFYASNNLHDSPKRKILSHFAIKAC